jgi:16S rRNA (guanine527-N7)-methyltransferase
MDRRPIREGTVALTLGRAGLSVAPGEAATLTAYLNLLLRWNRVYNLTGLQDRGALIERHLVESLALGPLLRGERVADVGSGAGLPGIPLAVTQPARRFTLIESRAKRVYFLRHAAGSLRLSNVDVAHGRAQTLTGVEPFDTVLARAVAGPEKLLAILRPLTRPGTRILLLTSAESSRAYAGLAPDFAALELGAAPVTELKSTIVALERR